MSDLVTFDGNQVVTDSRSVAKHFEKEHRDVLKAIRHLVEGVRKSSQTPSMFHETTYVNEQNGQVYPIYLMNRDGFSLLVMGFTGKKALEWKLKYIEAFNAMEAELKKVPQLSPAEEMARGLLAAQKVIAEKDEKIAELTPKGIFADAVSASQTSIPIGDLAKILKQNGVHVGRNTLFSLLRDEGYLMKHGSSKNLPTQRSMEMKLFEIKEGGYIDHRGINVTTRTTKVTGKGQIYFINKFLAKKGKGEQA